MSDVRRVFALCALVVAVVLTVVVFAAWVGDRTAGAPDPVATLACLDVSHRPLERHPGQNLVTVGVRVVGPESAYDVTVTANGQTASSQTLVDRPAPVRLPVTEPTLRISAIQIVPLAEADEAEPADVTDQVLGVDRQPIGLPDTEGPVDPAGAPCESQLAVHPGYPFAAPSPPFGAGSAADPAVVADAESVASALALADADSAFELLHPASIEGYGDEICRAHVDAVVPATPALRVQSVSTVSSYRFQRPGGEDLLDDVVLVEALADGVPWRFNLARHEGQLRWLSWCGN